MNLFDCALILSEPDDEPDDVRKGSFSLPEFIFTDNSFFFAA